MGLPVVVADSGGLAVTEATIGLPIEVASNGFGIAVTFVDSGGLPVSGGPLPPLPPGYVFYVDLNDAFLVDNDNNFWIGPA